MLCKMHYSHPPLFWEGLGRLGKLGGDIAIADRCNKVGDSLELCLAWHRFHHQSTCPSLPSRGDSLRVFLFFRRRWFCSQKRLAKLWCVHPGRLT